MTNIIKAENYVVLDVETNGLEKERDLLSISIYKPDDQTKYTRFFPLELDKRIYTTNINGITKNDLIGATELTQKEFDELIENFELNSRTVLIYGVYDKNVISNYLKRKHIIGIEKINFFNFKSNIFASDFSEGNVTKDNLCKLFEIDGVKNIHSGINDCILEWKLFLAMNNENLIVLRNSVYKYNNEWIIPVSYIVNYKYLRKKITCLPKLKCHLEELKSFELTKSITRFESNITGMAIENLIDSMLNVFNLKPIYIKFLKDNRDKLKYIGELESYRHIIPVKLNDDGTMSAQNKEDSTFIESVNNETLKLKEQLTPLVEYIKENIFFNKKVFSQEMVVNEKDNILALCDLSSDDSVLEIKTSCQNIEDIKYQLYYESNKRNTYILQMVWNQGITLKISKVTFEIINSNTIILDRKRRFENKINNPNIIVIEYFNLKEPIKLKCKNCNHEWNSSAKKILKNNKCPNCFPNIKKNNFKLSKDEMLNLRINNYKEKVYNRSEGKLLVNSYISSKENANISCLQCGYNWNSRADRILGKPYCPKCKNK